MALNINPLIIINVEFFLHIKSDLFIIFVIMFSSNIASAILETLHTFSVIYITYPSKIK